METEQAPGNGALSGWEGKALEGLRWDWDTAYLIGRDDEHGWYAGRRDKIGELITADDPDDLRRKIIENYQLKPVPRKSLPRTHADYGAAVLGADPGGLLTESAES